MFSKLTFTLHLIMICCMKVNKKEIEKLAKQKYGELAGIAQQYLFYWKREA